MRKALIIAILTVLVWSFWPYLLLTTATASTDLELTGTRNSDGTVTLRWSNTFQNGKGELAIKYKEPSYWSYIGLAKVPVSRGYYIHENPKNSPDSTYIYRVSPSVTQYEDVTVGPYRETPTDDNGETDPNAGDGGNGPDDSPFAGIFAGDKSISEVENNAGYIEKFLAKVIMIVPLFVYDVIGVKEPVEMIFNRDTANGMAPVSGLHLNTFKDGEYAAIGVIYERLREFVPISLVIVVALAGVFIMFNSASTKNRLTYQDYVSGFFICVALVQFGHYLWQFIFGLNYYLVEAFYSTIDGRLNGQGFLDTLCRWDTASAGMAIIAFVTVVVVAIMTWQYALRKIMLAILLVIFPVMAVVSVFPQTRGVFTLWIKELAANLFLQSGHAAAMALFIGFTAGGADFWTLMAFLLGLNSVAILVRRVIGADTFGSGVTGNMGTMLGLGSVIALSRMGRGLTGGRVGESPATDMLSGTSTTAATAAVPAGAVGSAGAMASMTRGAAVTAAGLAGGSVVAMATGNPGMGILAGGALGASVTGKFTQLHGFLKSVSEESEATGKPIISTAANRLGIYDVGQLYDGESAAQIGRNVMGGGVLGSVGALAGRGVSAMANVPRMFVSDFAAPAAQTGQNIANYRQKIITDMNQARQNIAELTPQYDIAKQQLEIARSPEAYPNPVERKLAVEDAQANLQNLSGRIAENKMTLLDGNHALSNQGMAQKMAELRHAHQPQSVDGGIYGFNWNRQPVWEERQK